MTEQLKDFTSAKMEKTLDVLAIGASPRSAQAVPTRQVLDQHHGRVLRRSRRPLNQVGSDLFP